MLRECEIEFEMGETFVNATLQLRYTPGEGPTYYRDGSACPGTGPDIELVAVYIDSAFDARGDITDVNNYEAFNFLESNQDLWYERVRDELC